MEKQKHIFISGRSRGHHKLGDPKGFTLVELLIAMAIFAIISVVIMTMFDSFQRGYTEQQVTSDVIQKARSALSFMTSEIKLAGLDPKETGSFQVITANATTFTYDFDSPSSTGSFNGTRDTDERRTYRFLNGKLEQLDNIGVTGEQKYDLVPKIDMASSSFQYWDSDRKILGDTSGTVSGDDLRKIAYVRIALTVIESAGRSGNISRSVQTLILCRNLQYNAQR